VQTLNLKNDQINGHAIQELCASIKDAELHAAAIISFSSLWAARRLWKSVNGFRQSLPMFNSTADELFFDTVVFEGAAFTYVYLMAEYLRDDGDDDDEKIDPYFECLKASLEFTAGIFKQYADFSVPDEFLRGRVISYRPTPSVDIASTIFGLPESFSTPDSAINSAGIQVASRLMVIAPPPHSGYVKPCEDRPWQNCYVERVIGSIRRECLNHIIVINDWHLRRILNSYLRYCHESRTHLSLEKDAPDSRKVHPRESGRIVQVPEVGGLHHRYERRAA